MTARGVGQSTNSPSNSPRLYVPSLRRLTHNAGSRVTRMGRAEPHTGRVSREDHSEAFIGIDTLKIATHVPHSAAAKFGSTILLTASMGNDLDQAAGLGSAPRTLCDTLNFRRAAKKCKVTQPAGPFESLNRNSEGYSFVGNGSTPGSLSFGRLVRPQLQEIAERATGVERAPRRFLKLENAPLRVGALCTIGPATITRL